MPPWEDEHWLPGVLCKRQMERLYKEGFIGGIENFKKAADYSSIDLHLSNEGYKMVQGSIKPCGEPTYLSFLNNPKFVERLSPNKDGHFDLLRGTCYVFKLKERLNTNLVGTNIFGQATAKSSVGRVDVIARLIVDGMYKYESMDPDYLGQGSGEMLIEIVPISFNVRVKEGISLSQLRFFYGDPDNALITDQGCIKCILYGSDDGKGYLSVDLSSLTIGECQVSAFRAKNSDLENSFIDLWKKEDGKPDPCQFWCFEKSDENDRLRIKNGEFYLLRSAERISLPDGVAVYCRPMDETLGEMRIHYAGFVHPFFGTERPDGKNGTPLIFEVRGHNVDITLADREKLAKLIFYRMSESAKEKKETKNQQGKGNEKEKYNKQELDLSKYFGDWPRKLSVSEDGHVRKAKEDNK